MSQQALRMNQARRNQLARGQANGRSTENADAPVALAVLSKRNGVLLVYEYLMTQR